MRDNFTYREEAKSKLIGKYGPVILTILVISIIIGIPQGFASQYHAVYEIDSVTFRLVLVDPGTPSLVNFFNLISFVFSAIGGYTLVNMFIKIANDATPNIESQLLVGIKENPTRTVVHTFIVSVFVTLWAILVVIPGIMAAYKYSMGIYLLNKESKLSAYEALEKSKKYMMGNRMQLFQLDLSYFGWYLLGIFTFGILWFWIYPKHNMARVLFYNDLYLANNPIAVNTTLLD
jgi:uncharacterized membrane protein